ncbi:Fe-S cluster assembly protein SufD [Noviherbaspirillum cavernae]|uniref:Fe-S cluster assembly protein SufD n=1 Tax=Noviherbaspirillum cavernae TaxID=2320862 RepID=A0A418X6A7_9BURK|nr:Fe-S cluster assembly protein SufD [Noviherbaspirillum cavernae]RJG08017.1 Fe-S cluster assembly protein SufD [Noviherbaspirillum cavernae]
MDMPSISSYREAFATLAPQLPGADLPWLQQLRLAALGRFEASGFPSTRNEDWKYTNVAPLAKRPFRVTPKEPTDAALRVLDGVLEPGGGSDHLLLFLNGRHVPGLSRPQTLPRGATVTTLAGALALHPDGLDAALDSNTEIDTENGFAALNAAFWSDGAYIDLAPGLVLENPIHLIFLCTEPDMACHTRNIIRAGINAHASVIEHYIGPDSTSYFTNAITRIEAADGAVIAHCKLQEESLRAFHIAAIDVRQQHGSRFDSHSFAFGALLSRTDIATRFDAEACSANLNGLYMAAGRQHVDHHTRVDHAMPRGTSREYYKGVLDGAARAVFNGKVIVHANAQKSDAFQSNRNLLLSENAEIDTKPQLEIYADDVKCSHGATVGQLDDEQIFYLRSRGVDEAAAKNLLTYAFAEEIVAMPGIASLRERLERLLLQRLPQRLPSDPPGWEQ